MQYTFPAAITLDEVRAVVARANARLETNVFIEADRGDYVIFNYVISFPEVFPFPGTGDADLDREYAILRECRGLTFYKDGRIAALKWNKFFNLLEKPETMPSVIDWRQPHFVYEKLDGSMITPFIEADGTVSWHTKMGNTDVAKLVAPFVVQSPALYEKFARDCASFNDGSGITPMFEFCSRSQRIVVDHPVDRMVLLGARFNDTGKYAGYDTLLEWGKDYRIEVVGRHSSETVGDIDAFLSATAGETGIEGYIIAFENGMRYKVKTDEYRTIHRVVSDLASEKAVVRLIVDNTLDDALPMLADEDRAYVLEFSRKLSEGLGETSKSVDDYVARGQAVTSDQRSFAEWVKANVPERLSGVVFRTARGEDAMEGLMALIGKNIGTGTRLEAVRDLWGGHRWVWGDQMGSRLDDA